MSTLLPRPLVARGRKLATITSHSIVAISLMVSMLALATPTSGQSPPNAALAAQDASLSPIQVIKTARPAVLGENGGEVSYGYTVKNLSVNPATITSLVDTILGDLDGRGNCSMPQILAPGDSYSCHVTAFVSASPGDSVTNQVTASGYLVAESEATVTIGDVPSSIEVTKTADPTGVPEPGGLVGFTVRVDNHSAVDSVTIDSLVDSVQGDLNGQGNCAVPQTIPAGGYYECSFSATVSGNPGYVETDVVTASGDDDDGNPVSDDDDAMVTVTDVPSSIEVTKTADPTEVAEPGGLVGFTVRVDNHSAVDSVTIDSLVDSVHGDLNGQGNCAVPQTIPAGGYYECSFSATVLGNPSYVETDVVTASGSDDDGNPVSDDDDATVTITDTPSSIQVTKTADPTEVIEPGGLVGYTVRVDNLSAVDSLTIDSLVDSIFGDLNGQGDCAVPQTIPAGGYYECSLSVTISGNAGDVVTNVVTASGDDDDGNPVSDDDDATVTIIGEPGPIDVVLYNDEDGDGIDDGDLLGPVHKVEISGVGQFTTGDTINVGSGQTVSYRLRRGGVVGPWQQATFPDAAPDGEWRLEFATVSIVLYNDEAGDGLGEEDWLTDPHQVEVSNVGQFATGDTIHVPPGANINFRLRRGGVEGPWQATQFEAGDYVWELEFATVSVVLYNDEAGDGIDETDFLASPHKVEVKDVAQFATGDTFHLPPGTNIDYRLRRGGVVGPWQATQFEAGDYVWELEFATVHIGLCVISNPPQVEISGVGIFNLGDTIHVPPGANLSFRILDPDAGPWMAAQFAPGDTVWDLEGAVDWSECNGMTFIEKQTDPDGTAETSEFSTNYSPNSTVVDDQADNSGPLGMELIKTATPDQVDEPGGQVTYEFVVINLSSAVPLKLDSLTDSVYGDLDGQGTCALPQTIPAGGSYSCQLTVVVSGQPGDSVTNVATAASPFRESASATVMVGLSPVVPEASTLMLFGSATSGLAAYVGLRLRSRRRR